MEIRPEKAEDTSAVYDLNRTVFETSTEAEIVDELRRNCGDTLSLVAVEGDEIYGHILFSPAFIESDDRIIEGTALAPMAVTSSRQRKGIGAKLIMKGFERLRQQGCPFVVVIGHPEYYPRFGFERASKYNLKSPWRGIPDEAFMIHFLAPLPIKNLSGTVTFRQEFDEAI